MADFVQTMKDWKRMCNAMGQEDEYTACDKCDLLWKLCIYNKRGSSHNVPTSFCGDADRSL